MAHTTPSSTITFYRVNCDSTYRNVWGFTSKTDLNTYLSGQPNHTYTDSHGNPIYLYYIRRNATVDIPEIFDDVEMYTYCKYNNNEERGDEYAFIVRKEFINMNCTRLYLQYDIWTNFLVNEGSYSNIYGNVERQLTYALNYQPDIMPVKSVLQSEQFIEMGSYIMIYITYDPQHRAVLRTESPSGQPYGKECIITEDRIGGAVLFVGSSDYDNMRNMLMAFSADQYVYNIYMCVVSSAARSAIISNSSTGYIYTVYQGTEYHTTAYLPDYLSNRFNKVNGFTWTATEYITHNYVSNNPKIYTRPYTICKILNGESEQDVDFADLPTNEIGLTYIKKTLSFSFNLHFASNGLILKTSLALNEGNIMWITNYGAIAKNTDSMWTALNTTIGSTLGVVSSAVNGSARGVATNGANLIGGLIEGYMAPDYPVYSTTIGNNKVICGGNGNICVRIYYPIEDELARIENYWDRYGYSINKYLRVSGINHAYYDYIKMNDVQIKTNDMCLEELNMMKQILTNGVSIYNDPSAYDLGTFVDSTTNLGG